MPRPVRAHLGAGKTALVALVEGHVVRHDHVRAAAHADLGHVDAASDEHVQLADERRGVDDDAVPDDGRDVRIHDAGRAELELHRLVAPHHRVAGVVAALVADHHRYLFREEVGRLAFAFVAPLEADDHRRGHHTSPDMKRPRPVPGSWIDVSRECPLELRRTGRSKVRFRLTGRTPRLPRAMVRPSIAVLAPRSLEDPGSIPNGGGRDTSSRVASGLRAPISELAVRRVGRDKASPEPTEAPAASGPARSNPIQPGGGGECGRSRG